MEEVKNLSNIEETNEVVEEKPLPLAKEKKVRDSNLELYRIITMILIVAHHYVVNSNLWYQGIIYSNLMSWKSIFLLLFGAWGKTGINCFVLITGYFMYKSNITLKKFLKLVLEFYFYKVVIGILFMSFGMIPFTVEEVINLIIPITEITYEFGQNFFVFYLTIPFLNILLKNTTEKQHILLIVLSLAVYCLFATIPFFNVSKNYFSWFIVLYFVSGYVGKYPRRIFNNKKIWAILTIISFVFSIFSIIICSWLSTKGIFSSYYFVEDSNNLLALTNGFTSFMLFKNIKIKPSKFINFISPTMFGVFCIHNHSDAMRKLLWNDLFNTTSAFNYNWMPLHAILSVLIVFIACVIIDLIRINFIEKPFFKLYDKVEVKLISIYKEFEDKVCEKHNIQR